LETATALNATTRDQAASNGAASAAVRPDLLRRALAEGFATFALVVAGCGAIIANQHSNDGLGVVGIGLVFGLPAPNRTSRVANYPISRS
jgi:hypothetical protein